MPRVLLVSFAGYPYSPSSLMPDNGLACLAGCLIDAGHEVRILDFSTVDTIRRLFPERLSRRVRPLAEKLFVENRKLSLIEKLSFLYAGHELEKFQTAEIGRVAEDVAREAEAWGAEYVGLKLWNGDGFSGSVQIAETLRRRLPQVRVLGGGPHVDYFGRHVLEYSDAFHALVHGEGEIVLPQLIEAMLRGQEWRRLPGVIWKEGEAIRRNPSEPIRDLDGLSLPVYDPEVYPALQGDRKIKIGVLDESRGCPNRCAFCIHPTKSGGKWTLKSPARVVEEARRLAGQLNSRYLIYSGSNTSAKAAIGIAEEILKQGLQVRYGCFGHVKGIARADFELLKRSGCEAIFYGLESASARILADAFNKPLNLADAERVIRDTQDAGIAAITSIIYPAPFEDAKSRQDTLDFLLRLRPDSVPVTPPGMIPGTPWEMQPAKYGFEKSRREDIWEYALTYKIKLLFPPSLWKPLPYTLNGKNSRRLFAECEQFIGALEGAGLLANLSHELILMADALGQRRDLRAFRNTCRSIFLSGRVEDIQALTGGINQNVQRAGVVHEPFARPAAVG